MIWRTTGRGKGLDEEYYGLSLTLGGGDVRLIDMVYAYSVFANGGVMAGQPVSEDGRQARLSHPGPHCQHLAGRGQGWPDRLQLSSSQPACGEPTARLPTGVQSDYNTRKASYGEPAALPGRCPIVPLRPRLNSTNN